MTDGPPRSAPGRLTVRQAKARALRRVAHWHATAALGLLRIGGGAEELRALSEVADALRARALQGPNAGQATTPPPRPR